MTSYAAPMTTAAYAPSYGYGAQVPHMPMGPNAELIDQTKLEHTGVINKQAEQQKTILDHQYEAQKKMLNAEANRNIEMTTAAVNHQLSQQLAPWMRPTSSRRCRLPWLSSSALWPSRSRRRRCLLRPSST